MNFSFFSPPRTFVVGVDQAPHGGHANVRTLTPRGGDLSEGVIAAVALAPDDPAFTGTLSSDGVARPRLRAKREALAGVARVPALGAIVVLLEERETQTLAFRPRFRGGKNQKRVCLCP